MGSILHLRTGLQCSTQAAAHVLAHADRFDIEVVKHPADAPIPDMTKLETAFQEYDVNSTQYESQFRFKKPIYIARHNPYMLARAVMDAGRQVLLKHGHQPTTVLVDLPCTLFMIDNRNMSVAEDMARLLTFSPEMTVRLSGCIPSLHLIKDAALVRCHLQQQTCAMVMRR